MANSLFVDDTISNGDSFSGRDTPRYASSVTLPDQEVMYGTFTNRDTTPSVYVDWYMVFRSIKADFERSTGITILDPKGAGYILSLGLDTVRVGSKLQLGIIDPSQITHYYTKHKRVLGSIPGLVSLSADALRLRLSMWGDNLKFLFPLTFLIDYQIFINTLAYRIMYYLMLSNRSIETDKWVTTMQQALSLKALDYSHGKLLNSFLALPCFSNRLKAETNEIIVNAIGDYHLQNYNTLEVE